MLSQHSLVGGQRTVNHERQLDIKSCWHACILSYLFICLFICLSLCGLLFFIVLGLGILGLFVFLSLLVNSYDG